ncbi:MAG TPA: BPSS1780 family membrane protein [Usitatibacteraceae bacterium]
MQQDNSGNPYQAPAVEVMTGAPQADAAFIEGGKAVAAGHGWDWIAAGWAIFIQSPLIWVVNVVILFIIHFVLGFIPFIGSLVTYVLFPVFNGGLMMGAQAQRSGRSLEVNDLFAGFKDKAGSLLTVGALYAVVSIALLIFAGILAIALLGASGAIGAIMSGDKAALMAIVGGATLGVIFIALLVMAAFIPIAMAFWFAPVLVALQDVSPTTAIRMSFYACLKNFVPFLLYGFIFLVLAVIAIIPFGLGLLVVVPLVLTSTYAAYRDIFLGE